MTKKIRLIAGVINKDINSPRQQRLYKEGLKKYSGPKQKRSINADNPTPFRFDGYKLRQ